MKNKHIFVSLMLILIIFVLGACQGPFVNIERGSGNLVTESRPVADFHAVRLDGAGRLMITQGEAEALEIVAEENILDELTSEVLGDTLVLGFKEQPWRKTLIPTEGITYNLTVVNLSEITLNGAGVLEIDPFEADKLYLLINGASQIKIANLSANALSVNISGTGTLSLSGQVISQKISVDGAGNYQAGDLLTESTEIDIDGLGNGTVWATEKLNVMIDGGGSVRFYGSPSVTQEIRGLGNIDNLGEK